MNYNRVCEDVTIKTNNNRFISSFPNDERYLFISVLSIPPSHHQCSSNASRSMLTSGTGIVGESKTSNISSKTASTKMNYRKKKVTFIITETDIVYKENKPEELSRKSGSSSTGGGLGELGFGFPILFVIFFDMSCTMSAGSFGFETPLLHMKSAWGCRASSQLWSHKILH